jgi:hypothetical protein
MKLALAILLRLHLLAIQSVKLAKNHTAQEVKESGKQPVDSRLQAESGQQTANSTQKIVDSK